MKWKKLIFIDQLFNKKDDSEDKKINKIKLLKQIQHLNINTEVISPEKLSIQKNNYSNHYCKKIYKKYHALGIKLNLSQIYQADEFLRTLKDKKNTLILSGYIYGPLQDLEIIFYELARKFKIVYLKPEQSAFKNRYVLSKNIYKHPVTISKNKLSFQKIKIFIMKYKQILKPHRNNTLTTHIHKKNTPDRNFLYYKNTFKEYLFYLYAIKKFKIRINENLDKEYLTLIFPNNIKLFQIAEIDLTSFILKALKSTDLDIVLLLHPKSALNSLIFFAGKYNFLEKFKNFSNRIILINQNNITNKIVENTKFYVHTTSSLSMQCTIYEKKIINLSNKKFYIGSKQSNIITFNKKNKSLSLSKISQSIEPDYRYINYILSNSLNNTGKFDLEFNKMNENFKRGRKYKTKIISELLKKFLKQNSN